TIMVLDSRGSDARDTSLALVIGAVVSGLVWLLEQPTLHEIIPETLFATFFGLAYAKMSAGFSVSLLSIGSGMIVGNRINVSIAIGSLLSWVIGPHILLHFGRIPHPPGRSNVIFLVIWPAARMLIARRLPAPLFRWC